MANIWRKDDNVKEQPKRNIMDLSFQNNLTTQFGKLVPVFCKEFIPGDSFSIKPTFSLKFQPMVFPIQTRMRAHLHFFKVRNRNLWKDWEDFIAKNKENLDPPYLDTAVTKPTTGSLLDYLGVPTTIVGAYGLPVGETVTLEVNRQLSTSTTASLTDLGRSPWLFSTSDIYGLLRVTNYGQGANKLVITPLESISLGDNSSLIAFDSYTHDIDIEKILETRQIGINLAARGTLEFDNQIYTSIDSFLNIAPPSTYDDKNYVSPQEYSNNTIGNCICCYLVDSSDTVLTRAFPLRNQGNGKLIFQFNSDDDISTATKMVIFVPVGLHGGYSSIAPGESGFAIQSNYNEFFYSTENYIYPYQLVYYYTQPGVVDIDDSTSPYWRSGATGDLRERIKLSALPCRAYEQIYNSFYRNAENNPYILNGVPEYNKYMPTDEGGVDANLYDFYYRNWEDDFLTTALQQPQAGIAPLVGLTGTAGTATVTLADENGNTSEATASYDEEGNVTSVAFANNTSLTEALADAVTYGISINDLRNVNAFQRWLEAKARGGYKYRDVIETMFGISVRYDTLDMPEFIGGTSIDIMVNQISQTTPTETSPLGDYAGQAAGIGTGETINEYFDEHGFVIGILSVVPVPNYSQLLPKHFIKRDAFDYYFPQFGHIGMQPIKYDEVCPVQAYQESTEQNNVLDETFGYQRAWYDYLASTDEVHGEFRTNLRNFVMNRTFDVKPELVNEFLTVDPSQLNDVFAIEDDSYDKILGQIYFDVKAKRPIPLYGIPKLE